MGEGTHTGKYSCTLALLWLKRSIIPTTQLLYVCVLICDNYRALEFILGFLRCIAEGEKDLVVCARAAYEGSLRRYHGWIVRGIFSVRVHMCVCV